MTIVESKPVLLGELINGRRFDVPEIQRAYAFAINNSDDAEANAAGATFLKNDLFSFHSTIAETDRNYFLGSIIVQSDHGFQNDDEVFDLLDGQQRITTLSLLFNEIYRELVEHAEFEDLALLVKRTFLDFDTQRFDEPEAGWQSCLYPRRMSDRIAYRQAMAGADLEEFQEGNIRDVVEDFRSFVRNFSTPEELASFADTLLHRVEILILCVPNTAMAFQMFQTANARGTPLSQLDMFRSTVVMQAQTKLQLEREEIDRLLGFLRHIENRLTEKYPDESNRAKKIDQFMKYWLWIRRGTDSGGVSYIMRMVEACGDESELTHVVFDLYQHVDVWCTEVDLTCSNIPHSVPLHPIFPKVTEGWKMFYLAVKTARKYARRSHPLSQRQENLLLELMTWWYLIEYSHNGATNTTPFRSLWSNLAHRTWHHSAQCNVDFDGWNDEMFNEKIDALIGDFEFEEFPSLKPNSFEINDKDAKGATPVLGQFERLGGREGLRTRSGAKMRQGSATRDTTLIHLVPSRYLTPPLANSIGNRTLIVGHAEGGRKVRELENDMGRWDTAGEHLNGLIDGVSLLSRTNQWPQDMANPHQLQSFIRHRNQVIIDVLNRGLDDFVSQSFEG